MRAWILCILDGEITKLIHIRYHRKLRYEASVSRATLGAQVNYGKVRKTKPPHGKEKPDAPSA
jgi:hypothetical protein